VTVHAERAGDQLCLRVIDTGIGIAESDLARIFEEFVQVPGPEQARGTGLGLPLSRKLAELLGGTLEVASRQGAGTTFTVALPLQGSPADDAEAPVSAAGAVLVVDDDEASRYVVRMHLRDSAWQVREASGGEAALAAIAQGLPVAVILDLSMPDLDGIEVLRRLRARDDARSLPVIVHTSRLLDPGARAAIERQGALILDKSSTSRTTLISALSQLTGGARGA
jgi:CheY-like chemotaxis protein